MLQTGRTSGHARPSHGEGQRQNSWRFFSPISATSTIASTPAAVSASFGGSEARSTFPLACNPDGVPQRMILAYSPFVRHGRDGWGQGQSARTASNMMGAVVVLSGIAQ